uniref:Uncharacterized protein n=1 Tax=Pyrodinium bahamense TaxID=73915 RepID=A0A7S0B005_9DINO
MILSNNRVGDAGAEALAKALCSNQTLLELRLGNGVFIDSNRNSIGEAGAKALEEALQTNRALRKMDLRYNWIPESTLTRIEEALIGRSLQETGASGSEEP